MHMWMKVGFLLFTVVTAHAKEVSVSRVPSMASFDTYEGIDPVKIGNFWDTWKLVTVRYRKDVEEQRFVYANPIAWKALKEGKKKFPDGSLFGKIAFNTGVDTAFPVSMIPNKFSRIQIMKKDAKAYAKTGGWGYAIYPAVKRDGQSPENVVGACFACHNIIPQKDYIFSTSAFFVDSPQSVSEFAGR